MENVAALASRKPWRTKTSTGTAYRPPVLLLAALSSSPPWRTMLPSRHDLPWNSHRKLRVYQSRFLPGMQQPASCAPSAARCLRLSSPRAHADLDFP